jgi:hypothetical protein
MSKARKFIGSVEPNCEHLEESADFDWELHKLVNWYRRHPTTTKKEKKWVVDYVAHTQGKKSSASYLYGDPYDYSFIAAYCRILSKLPKTFSIPSKSLHHTVDLELKKIRKKSTGKLSERKKRAKESKVKVVSVQERIYDQIREYMSEVERQIDILFDDPKIKKSDWFQMDKWLLKNSVKGQQTNAILKNIKRVAAELEESCEGECSQLKEAYKFVSKPFRRRILDCYHTWIFHLENHIESLNKSKASRRKAISPEKRVRKTSYLPEFKENGINIVSLHPKEIIYASTAIVYDTKNRLLTVYVAKQNKQLTIEGTTIKNYAEDHSYTKKVRSPASSTGVCSNCNSKSLVLKHIDELKTKRQVIRKRLNKNTVILKVF